MESRTSCLSLMVEKMALTTASRKREAVAVCVLVDAIFIVLYLLT
jgi:hypothetical protein